MRVRILGATALVLGSLLVQSTAAPAAETRLVASLGSTFAAAGDPGDGGPALSLSALWPFEPGLEFGVMAFADDVGNRLGSLIDPNDPSLRLGAVQEAQRWTFGGAWRLDASLPGSSWVPFASATWGYYRVKRDQLGVVSRAQSATGASLAIGIRRLLAGGAALGLSARYHELTSDELERYVQVTLDGSVRWGQ